MTSADFTSEEMLQIQKDAAESHLKVMNIFSAKMAKRYFDIVRQFAEALGEKEALSKITNANREEFVTHLISKIVDLTEENKLLKSQMNNCEIL